jgi:hypothetical protein
VGPFKDSAGPNGEIQFVVIAAVVAALANGDPVGLMARGADRTIRPEPNFQINTSGFSIGNEFEKLKGAYCASAHWVNL